MKYELKALYDMNFNASPYIELKFFTDIIFRKVDRYGNTNLYSRDVMSGDNNGAIWKSIKPFSLILFRVYAKPYKNNSIEAPIIKTSLTERSKWMLCKRIKTIIEAINIDEDLFYLSNGKLVLNDKEALKYEEYVRTSNSHVLRVAPSVVPIIKNNDIQEEPELYEGIVIDIPEVTSGVKMTFEEAEYFVDYLDKFDMDLMTMQVINNCKFTNISGQIVNTGIKIESLCKELKEENEEIEEEKEIEKK